MKRARLAVIVIALACAVAALSFVAATDADDGPDSNPGDERILIATDADGGSDPPPGGGAARIPTHDSWISTHDRVLAHEALPCTGLKEPINFEIFAAGPKVAGLPMTAVSRRCDATAPAYEAPANEITYVYGDCTIAEGETGCTPPLEVQTWPACQRSKADYSFAGKPLPSRELPKRGGAEVVEIAFPFGRRIEVYARSSTIVIYAESRELAREAVKLLAPQEKGTRPATNRADLNKEPPQILGSPSDGAMEGELQCQA